MTLPPPTAVQQDPNLSYQTKQWLHEIYKSGWRDILGPIEVRGVGANDPTWSQIGSGPFRAYKFALNDECWVSFHIPHDYKLGSDMHIHAHWIPDGTNTASVKWQFEYMFAKGHNQAAFAPAGTTITAEEAPPGTAYQHMVTETIAISDSAFEPDGLLYCCITRVTNGGTDNTDGIFLLTADVHYQSVNFATKNKEPDFYK